MVINIKMFGWRRSYKMFIRLNTVLIPEDKVQDNLVKLAKKIGINEKCLFHIDNNKFFSHITLYSPEYPTSNFEKVVTCVREISKRTEKTVLEFDGFVAKYGYLVMGFKKSKAINNLHKLVLQKLNPLREGRIREKYEKEIKDGKYTKEEVNNIKKYSYHHVLESYYPHLTLARFETDEIAQKVKSKLLEKIIPRNITFPYIAVSEMGSNGTCTNILQKFELRK